MPLFNQPTNQPTKGKDTMENIRFHLDFMIMMMMAGRTEEASRALAELREEIQHVENQMADQRQDA
jgi:hypothetical protein